MFNAVLSERDKMKTVFPNREIPHKWAHATQEHARGSNLSFQGDTLYSYSTPIAKLYAKDGAKLALFSDFSYSATTSKHLSYARRAVSHLHTITLPRYVIGGGAGRYRYSAGAKDDHKQNLEYLAKLAGFRCRLAQYGYQHADGSVYFVSSEKGPHQAWRMYTVRRLSGPKGDIADVGGFQTYASAVTANKYAKAYASGNKATP
jgi:hypothetical protein